MLKATTQKRPLAIHSPSTALIPTDLLTREQNTLSSTEQTPVSYEALPNTLPDATLAYYTRSIAELQQKNAELLRQNEALDAFAHTVAHDLKNPLTLVIGFAELVRDAYDGLPQASITKYLNTIVQNGLKIASIVDALMTLAGVSNSVEAEIDAVDMRYILSETLRRLEPIVEERKAEIKVPKRWPVAKGYAPWIEEIWYNYLSNAIQYGGTPPKLQLGAEKTENNMVRFWIKDNGPGLTLAECAALFTPKSRTPRDIAEGHGFGLLIVRRIAERMEGSVGVESKLGQGSTFYFTLPAATT